MGAHQQIGLAPSPAVMAILSRFDRPTLEAFLTVAVDLLDTLDPDPDAEQSTWPEASESREHDAGLPEDSEAGGDEADAAWPEWQTRAGTSSVEAAARLPAQSMRMTKTTIPTQAWKMIRLASIPKKIWPWTIKGATAILTPSANKWRRTCQCSPW